MSHHDQFLVMEAKKDEFEHLAEAGESLLQLVLEDLISKDFEEENISALKELISSKVSHQKKIGGRLPLRVSHQKYTRYFSSQSKPSEI